MSGHASHIVGLSKRAQRLIIIEIVVLLGGFVFTYGLWSLLDTYGIAREVPVTIIMIIVGIAALIAIVLWTRKAPYN